MKSLLTKKIIVVSAVVLSIVVGAVILAFATGNTNLPTLEDPKGVFYERLDEQGNVIYKITNEELYEEVKKNDGIQQLLIMVDSLLLSEYLENVTDDEIANKILRLTYGTDDQDIIAEMEPEDVTKMQADFDRSMVLAGYKDNPEDYVRILVAREKYAVDSYREDVTAVEVATAFISKYFEDMSAIKIRFTSDDDAQDVLNKFNLANYNDDSLRKYIGFTYADETLLDNEDNIVEAYETVEVYYFDEDNNLVNLDDEIIYELGSNDIYTNEDDDTFRLDVAGNLIDATSVITVKKEHIFTTIETAMLYKELNTFYYTMSKTDNYDEDEDILVKDSSDNLVYTIKPNGDIFDTDDVDVTDTADLIFNKEYEDIEDVNVFTANNTIELSEQEILDHYIEMYNYVYGLYRDTLPLESTKQQLMALDNDFLDFNFDEVYEDQSALATYLFKTISALNDKTYSIEPQSVSSSTSTFYYMVYKLNEPDKVDLGDIVLDLIEETIVLPENIVTDITLPATSEYGATITWTSADKTVISNAGLVTPPDVATRVDMSYTIKVLGETRTGKIAVNVLPTGENSEVEEVNQTFPELKTLINDNDLYDQIVEDLVDTKVYGSSGTSNVTKKLVSLRNDSSLTIYDYYLALDYTQIDSTYEWDSNGDKRLVATLKLDADSEELTEISADELFEYALAKNPAIYTMYASQVEELVYSEFFTEIFGEQTNLKRNSSPRMEEMYEAIASAKQYYTYIKSLYEQYGMEYNFNTFSDYSYSQYGTKTELALLEHFVTRELQPYLINSILEEYNVVEQLLSTVEDNYENYFSLDVVQLLVFIDFDEDGKPDDYNDYVDALTPAELDTFNALIASLEIAIDDFDGDFDDLVKEYQEASREDETWGTFKQNGILLLTEDLNAQDSEDQNVTHSLTYSGEYGVKDSFADEFTEALIALYQEYQLEQNQSLSELLSDLVTTQFGLHLILVEKGDDFDQFSAKFTEEDTNGIEYSETAFNDSDKPTLAQMELYAQYRFYEMVYDMTNADLEEKYGIVVPKIPASVSEALDFYFDDVLSNFYVIGTVNISLAQLLESGNFVNNDYTTLTEEQLIANLEDVGNAYYEAILGRYLED